VVGSRWAALVALAAVAVAGAGCASSSGGGTTVRKAAILLPGTLNDEEWTSHGRRAFEEVVSRLRVRGSVATAERAAEAKAALEQLAGEKPQLVIADDSRFAAAAAQVAKQTKVPMLVWGDPGALKQGLVGDVEVEGRVAGYLAGFIGARSSITQQVGIVVADDGTPSDLRLWHEMAGAYAAGARSIEAKVRAHYIEVGSGGDATPAAVDQATRTLMKRGAQYIIALGRGTTVGAFRSIAHGYPGPEHLFGGVIGNKEVLNQDLNQVFVSIPWNFAVVFRRALADVRSGDFGKRVYTLTLANGGLAVRPTGRTPNDAFEDAMKLPPKIARGAVKVPTTPTAAQVRALVNE
jgi:basic membrane lipoprotein Med (substrate-binding protein (PBP1-ABC) superfamily)